MHSADPTLRSNHPRDDKSARRPWPRIGMAIGLVLACAMLAGAYWAELNNAPTGPAAKYTYEVVKTYPHDARAFCQGLIFVDGHLYEGTGLYGESTIRDVDLATGRVTQSQALNPQLFGEGITAWGDTLIQLTWKNRLIIVYDRKTLQPIKQFRLTGEGWGLTHDGKQLIVSDGSEFLQFLDPKSFQVVRKLRVTDQRRAVNNLNELEFVDGEIWANIWYTDRIARINPKTGAVVGWIDLTGLLPADEKTQDGVLNGIAYDEQNKRLFVTGKRWPRLFEIKVVPAVE